MKLAHVLFSTVAFLALVASPSFAQAKPKPNNNKTQPQKPVPPPDLSAESITVKWKDKTTVEVTGTIKNKGQTEFSGARAVMLKITGTDKKTEQVKQDTVTKLAADKTFTIKFEVTDVAKYFAKGVTWTLEIYEGDDNKKNDAKTTTLDPGKPPAK